MDDIFVFEELSAGVRELMDTDFKLAMQGNTGYVAHDERVEEAAALFINDDGLPYISYNAVMFGLFTINPSLRHSSHARPAVDIAARI